MASKTVEQLKVIYPDPLWRRKFVDFCELIKLLADCVIADNYAVSDEMNGAIKLSDAGNEMLTQLTVKQKVKPKDARLMCALTIGHEELFVDIDQINIDKVVEAIDIELRKKTIRFPFVYGREFYNTFASLFETEKGYLTNEETLRLLDRLPEGVFQYGVFTIGPYGLKVSQSARSVTASRRVPAYHCSGPTCHLIHSVQLQTGQQAPINHNRNKLREILQSSCSEGSEWLEFASELSGQSSARYGDQRAGVLLPLIGDCLSTKELQLLVADLFDNTRGQFRDAVKDFLDVRESHVATLQMNRAQLLQLVLIAEEDVVSSSLDRLVRNGKIIVPLGDIRSPVTNRNARSGAFRLHAELGHYGVRFVSDDPGLALLRERRLLKRLYLRDPEADVQELEWQLRGIDFEDLDEKLEHFFHARTPSEALERLVLARKSNMITACHEVGIDHGDEMTDDHLIGTLLWKLGFPIEANEDPHADFWRQHERLAALTQSSAIGSSQRFVEVASSYFRDLEGLLLDSLAFTAWAFLADHTAKDAPFTYDDQDDRHEGLALLESARTCVSGEDPHPVDYSSERAELRGLMEGFGVLAKYLDRCRKERSKSPETHVRPDSELPEYDGKTDLKLYLLRSTLPFLDLSQPSQERIINGLREISSTMMAAEVNQVRNDYAHYRRTAPDISRVEAALDATRQSVTKIENLGFCRLLFVPSAVKTDRWGQSMHEFKGPRSYEHIFARPTPLDWMGLPPLTESQYLVRAASFGDPNEVLRFTRRYRSEFSEIWHSFPNRRRRGPDSAAVEEEAAHQEDVELPAT